MCNSTTFALRHTQISLSGISRHFRPPSRHLLLNTHDTNMEFLQLNGPLLDIFLFFSKTKIFHSHPCYSNVSNLNPCPCFSSPQFLSAKSLSFKRVYLEARCLKGPAHAATFAYCNPQYRACNNRRPPCSKPAGLAGGLQGDRENFYPCKKVAVL